jgi:acyl-CoA synthetase (AMP-forming)/AMP-acid ligase II
VYPREIEEVLLHHPAISDCAVIGIPDARWGERLRACVILKAGERTSSEEIQSFCRRSLADYKVPRDIVTVEELPRNANGKVLKRILRDSFQEASHV